jgi:hypothetical protein
MGLVVLGGRPIFPRMSNLVVGVYEGVLANLGLLVLGSVHLTISFPQLNGDMSTVRADGTDAVENTEKKPTYLHLGHSAAYPSTWP